MTTSPNKPTDVDVINAMRAYGGSFVQALAEAALNADTTNLQLIKSTWPQYWNRYGEMAEAMPESTNYDQFPGHINNPAKMKGKP